MFRKRKTNFPPGTFIPTPARTCAIIQLCLAFSALFWNASQPFAGEIFTLKSRLLLYQDVMGISTANATSPLSNEKTEHLARNAKRFQALPKKTRELLLDHFHSLKRQLQRPFFDKVIAVVDLFAYRLSPYELAWMFFSIVLPILLLKRVEGAREALWLIPLLVALYAFDSQFFAKSDQHSLESRLFPSETELIENHLNEPLSEEILEQHQQLKLGWERYLIANWLNQPPSEDSLTFARQVEEGGFHFTLARLKAEPKPSALTPFKNAPPSFPLLVLYFFWNTYFAYTAWKYRHIYSCSPAFSFK